MGSGLFLRAGDTSHDPEGNGAIPPVLWVRTYAASPFRPALRPAPCLSAPMSPSARPAPPRKRGAGPTGVTSHVRKSRTILVPEELLRLVAVAEFQSRRDALRHDFQAQAEGDR
jgi:hypothetical protein